MIRFCRGLATIMLFLGLIGSIYLANRLGIRVDVYYSHYMERDWILTIAIFLTGIFFTFVFMAVLLALADILEKVEDTSWTLNEIMRQAQRKREAQKRKGWKCPKCGRINTLQTGTCACGTERPSRQQ